jgi:GLPGLI family protein
MKQVIFSLSLCLFFCGAALAQDYSLLYQRSVNAPSSQPNSPVSASRAQGVSYERLLVKGNHSIYYKTDFDTLFNAQYQNNLKGMVYYGDISKKEILLTDNTYLQGYGTKYPFSASSDWKIHKEFIPFQQYKAYLATKQTAKGETIKAYFVPQIQITVGPEQYAGLPGLIVRMETASGVLQLKKIERPKLAAFDRTGLGALTIIPNEDFRIKRVTAVLTHLKTSPPPAPKNAPKQCVAPKKK